LLDTIATKIVDISQVNMEGLMIDQRCERRESNGVTLEVSDGE